MVLLRELDAIEAGRRELLQRLMLLDARMDNPDPLDVERAGLCSRCQPTMDGPLCAHCEAEEFFQVMTQVSFVYSSKILKSLCCAFYHNQEETHKRWRLLKCLRN
jgi:hypothetical protein